MIDFRVHMVWSTGQHDSVSACLFHPGDGFFAHLLDIKADNEERHRWLTGTSISPVLENLEYLAGVNKLEEIRTVCIPQQLNSEATIQVAAEILKPYLLKKDIRYKLIKYRHFGVRQEYRDYEEPTPEYMEELRALAEQSGFRNIVII